MDCNNLEINAIVNVECSSHGSCINNTCICDDNWSGASDFVNTESLDCQINNYIILGLWILNIVVILYVYISSASIIIARTYNFIEQKKSKIDYNIFKNRGLLAVYVVFSICLPAQLAYSILKVINQNVHIGFDIAPTILFSIAKLGFYLSVTAYQPALLATVLKQEKNVKKLLQFNTIGSASLQSIAIFIGFFPVFFFNQIKNIWNIEQQILLVRSYYIIQAIALYLNAVFAIFISKKVTRILNASASLNYNKDTNQSDKMNKLKNRINGVQATIYKQALLQGTIYLVFGFFPYLYNKHDYFLPISWIGKIFFNIYFYNFYNFYKY